MPRQCTVCAHPKRTEIDKALVGGSSFRKISERFGTTVTALFRHKQVHVPVALTKAHEAREVARADTLLDRIRSLCDRTECFMADAEEVMGDAKQSKDNRTRLDAIRTAAIAARELRSQFELLGQLSGELSRQGAPVNVIAPGATFFIPLPGQPAPALPAPIDVKPIDLKEDE